MAVRLSYILDAWCLKVKELGTEVQCVISGFRSRSRWELLDAWRLEDGTGGLARNVGKKLYHYSLSNNPEEGEFSNNPEKGEFSK